MTQDQSPGGIGIGELDDNGALYTSLVMAEVTRRRNAMKPKWSAERLAREMAAVGVPWTRNTVANLENGRRKQITAHELLALAWVLDVANPSELLAPDGGAREQWFPVTPAILVATTSVRAWCRGETGPLRQALAGPAEDEPEDLAEQLAALPADIRQQLAMMVRSLNQSARAPIANGSAGPGDGPNRLSSVTTTRSSAAR